jgi:nitrogen fixation/metabolism regulation signal transduction histidine kinase
VSRPTGREVSLRTRLVVALLSMALLPIAAFTLYTRYQIGVASQWWMLPGVERALDASLEVSRGAMARLDASSMTEAKSLAASLPDRDLTRDQESALREELRESGMDLLQIYRRKGRSWRLERQYVPEHVIEPMRLNVAAEIDSAMRSGGPLHSPLGLLGAVVRSPDGRAVVAAVHVQPGFFADVEQIGRGASYYRGHGVVADIQREYAWMLAAMLLVALTVVALVVSAGLARAISRPLRELADALGRIAAGEWSARVRPGGAAELRRLGEAFNAMAGRLEEARGALQRAEREAAWRDVAQRLAHEFKNILTPMSLSLYMLARDAAGAGGTDDVRESLGALERGVAHLTRLAEQFSQYARLPEPRLEPLDLAELARTASANVGADVRVEVHADGRVPVVGDSLLLARAIHNLVLNACEASAPGASVEVRVHTEGAEAMLDVLDRGAGVAEEVRARLFQPYVSTKRRGSGLGLALVGDIARQHRGSAALAGRDGGGTRARLSLPLAGA